MVQLNRVRVALTGFAGGPGVSTFYFLGLQTARDSLQTLYQGFAAWMPDDVSIRVDSAGDIIESETGDLVGAWSQTPLPVIPGLQTGVYAAPSGLMARWGTNRIVGSRRVRGRTFVVPAGVEAFTNAGQVTAAAQSVLGTTMTSFVFEQSLDFVIWNRPFAGTPATATRPARPARLGSHSLVTSGSLSPKVVVLRSRRD